MASKGINKVILIGNLGQDPEVRYTPNGKAVANLSIATSESWKDQSGQVQERTEWHKVVIWGKTAEVAGQYLRKGSQVYIEGKLNTRRWDKDGETRYSTEVVVQGFEDKMQMLGGGRDSQPTGQTGGFNQQQQRDGVPQSGMNQSSRQGQGFNQQPAHQQPMKEPDFDFDDDIPFARIGLQYPSLLNCM